MRVSKIQKALFIIVNQVAATLFPHEISGSFVGSPPGSDDSDALTTRDSMGTMSYATSYLFPRAKNGNNGNKDEGPSCQRCRKKCPAKFIKDPDNCRKCVRCPANQRGNADSTKCVSKRERNKNDKEKKYKKKKVQMRDEYKKTSYPKKKDKQKTVWEKREKMRIDNENRKKVRFMGRCLVIVPLAMGGEFAAEFAGDPGYFDEDFLEHYAGDLLQYWPSELDVPKWIEESDDSIYDSDDFVDKYIQVGNSVAQGEIETRGLSLDDDDEVANGGTDMAVAVAVPEAPVVRRKPLPYVVERGPGDMIVAEDHDKRFAFLIPIFAAIASTIGKIVSSLAKSGSAIAKLTKGTVKVGKGSKSKNSYAKQSDGFKKIATKGEKYWKSCLGRQSP